MNPASEALLLTLDAPAPSAGAGLLANIPLLLLFVGVFYFLVFRPQQKEAAEHQKLVAGLQKGDKVVTSGGIHGRVVEARSDTLLLEISPGAQLVVDRDVVKRKVDPAKEAAKDAPKDATAPKGA